MSQLGAFSQSPLGGFQQSPLGARGGSGDVLWQCEYLEATGQGSTIFPAVGFVLIPPGVNLNADGWATLVETKSANYFGIAPNQAVPFDPFYGSGVYTKNGGINGQNTVSNDPVSAVINWSVEFFDPVDTVVSVWLQLAPQLNPGGTAYFAASNNDPTIPSSGQVSIYTYAGVDAINFGVNGILMTQGVFFGMWFAGQVFVKPPVLTIEVVDYSVVRCGDHHALPTVDNIFNVPINPPPPTYTCASCTKKVTPP